jgi:hypothetical protein
MTTTTIACDDIPGDTVAALLDDLHALLAPDGAWTQHAWGRDSAGSKLERPQDIRGHAVCRCLLGGVDTVTADLALQSAVIRALRRALDRDNEPPQRSVSGGDPQRCVNLTHFNDAATKPAVLQLISDARSLAAASSWPRWQENTLPDRPPTPQEIDGLHLELQCFDELYFAASSPYAGQFNATASLQLAAEARQTAVGEYLSAHQTLVDAHLRASDV